jgi:NAD+ diphosphatase
MFSRAKRPKVQDQLNLPVAQSTLDRDYLMRNNPDLFDILWQNPLTRVVVLHEGKTLLRDSSDDSGLPGPAAELRLMTVEEVTSAQLRVYLGKTLVASDTEPEQTPVVLAVVSANSAHLVEPDADRWHQLKRSGNGLSERDSELFAQALALANWHASHVYCPKCGAPTSITRGGWVRTCFNENYEVFPRTDPAIIVSVIDADDRILLGSQGSWGANRWSVLAGFVEPGESLNHAVVREVFEEAGIRVANPQFLGSQAWPHPHSLMVGYTAKVDPAHAHLAATPDGEEIVKLRWFSREDFVAEAGSLLLPGKGSISRALIEHWYGSELPTGEAW